MMSSPMAEQLAGRGAARSIRRRARATGRRPGWVTYLVLSIVLLASIYPLWFTIQMASSDKETIARNPIPGLLPNGNLFANIRRVLESDINIGTATINSIIVATITSLSVVFFSTLAGYSFSKLRFRGRNQLLAFVVATMAVPTQLGVVPLFIVMSELEWVGKLQAVIVPGMVTAFGVFWMTQYLQDALPFEIIEAARVDGASMIRTFWSIALPAARPAAATLGLFTFVGSWTNFFWPFVILGSANPTLPVALQLLQASYSKDYSLIMAGVVVATVPLIALFAATGKQLVAGIMQGAVKG